jgi:hypothetical protein
MLDRPGQRTGRAFGGITIKIRHSKTDQEAAGAMIAIVRGSVACPVTALKKWCAVAAISEGPIFLPINKAGRVLPRASRINRSR